MQQAIAIFSTLGIIISFCFFLSPLGTFLRSLKIRKIDNIPVLFLFANFLNSFLWVGYALKMGIMQIFIPNAANVILQTLYISIFFIIHKEKEKELQLKIFLCAVAFTFFLVVFAPVSVIGIFAMLLNIATFVSLVEKLVPALRYRDPKYLNILVISIATVNGTCWLLFAILIKDIWIIIPNAIGLCTGFLQIYVYLWAKHSFEKSKYTIPFLKKALRVKSKA